MRIFLLPGYLEDQRIFDGLRPALQRLGETVDVHYPPILDELPLKRPQIRDFAALVAQKNQIENGDLLIGHSFGGWAAANIQQQTGSPVVQLCSFTDPAHICKPALVWALRNGLVQAGLLKTRLPHYAIEYRYKGKSSLEAIRICRSVMKEWPNDRLVKVLRLMNFPALSAPNAPLLRLHGAKDKVVRPPREWHISIPGDHFIHWTKPNFTLQIIENWTKNGFRL